MLKAKAADGKNRDPSVTRDRNIEWFEPLHRGGGGKASDQYLTVSKAVASKGHPKHQVTITLSEELMSDLRWVIGDRVVIGMDDDGFCFVRRVASRDGYTITFSGGNRKSKRAIIKLSERGRLTAVDRTIIDRSDISTQDGVLMFLYPSAEPTVT